MWVGTPVWVLFKPHSDFLDWMGVLREPGEVVKVLPNGHLVVKLIRFGHDPARRSDRTYILVAVDPKEVEYRHG